MAAGGLGFVGFRPAWHRVADILISQKEVPSDAEVFLHQVSSIQYSEASAINLKTSCLRLPVFRRTTCIVKFSGGLCSQLKLQLNDSSSHPREVLEDLRFALKVMEERSHLGLDVQAARALRNTICSQIAKIEALIDRERVAATESPALEIPEEG